MLHENIFFLMFFTIVFIFFVYNNHMIESYKTTYYLRNRDIERLYKYHKEQIEKKLNEIK